MKILGIDPGIERLGWAIVEEINGTIVYKKSGTKKTSAKKTTGARLLELFEFLDDLIKKERPNKAGVEKLFFSTNAKTAIIIGEVRGVILTSLEKHAVIINDFSPQEIKKLVTGDGGADKKQVARMLSLILKLPQRTMIDDETDAIAIAVAAITKKQPHH